jgi:hypothetical protein
MNIRVAPLERPLRTSDHPVTTRLSPSMVSDESSSTLSKIRLDESAGNVKRMIAAWSVGAISVRIPFWKRTP